VPGFEVFQQALGTRDVVSLSLILCRRTESSSMSKVTRNSLRKKRKIAQGECLQNLVPCVSKTDEPCTGRS
jgi:hypothetical protein